MIKAAFILLFCSDRAYIEPEIVRLRSIDQTRAAVVYRLLSSATAIQLITQTFPEPYSKCNEA